MRRLLRDIVGKLSADIFECEDGEHALLAYREHRPDWVTMDIEMGEKDGLTTTREICAEFPQARIVIVTKHDSTAMREAARSAGVFGYVSKENLLNLRQLIQPVPGF